jgi:mono/diheme cytochrome c family protein
MLRRFLIVSAAVLASGSAHAADRPPDGAALYRRHCQVCHGRTATDGDGGDIRGMSAKLVRSALRGVEKMPAFRFSDAEIEAITAHLASLDGN